MSKNNKIKKFFKKYKNQNKTLRILFPLIGFIYLISLILFTKSILSLVGIEDLIRTIILVILYLYLLIYFVLGIIRLYTKKHIRLIILMIIAVLFIPIQLVGFFYIDKTYGIIDKIQKDYLTYTSYMVTMKDKKEYNRIGIISNTSDPTGYIIPKEMITKYNISGELVEYDDNIKMATDLYDGIIDAMFVQDNYITMLSSYEKFENIEEETKIVYEHSKELKNTDKVTYTTKNLTEPFTVLLMGVDATGDGISKGASFNGDTLMLISFNPKTLSSTIFSIPRDTFVPIACRNNAEAKINSSSYGGTSCVVNTIQNLTDIPIDYYIKINFNGVVQLVDSMGGIEVDVPVKFCEQDSQRRRGDYLICLEKGPQKLNGEQALALSRHRKTLPLGDFQRVQHQQLVLESMVTGLKDIKDLDTFYGILESVANNIDTNMSNQQILSIYNVIKDVLTNKYGENIKPSIQKTYLTGYDLTPYLPSTRSYSYTFQYYKQSLNEITKAMKVNLGIEEATPIKTFSFSVDEEYTKKVIGKTYYTETRRELIPDFTGKTKSEVEAWCTSRNIQVTFTSVKPGDTLFSSSLPNNTVVSQNVHKGIIVDTIENITFSIIENQSSTIIDSNIDE